MLSEYAEMSLLYAANSPVVHFSRGGRFKGKDQIAGKTPVYNGFSIDCFRRFATETKRRL